MTGNFFYLGFRVSGQVWVLYTVAQATFISRHMKIHSGSFVYSFLNVVSNPLTEGVYVESHWLHLD